MSKLLLECNNLVKSFNGKDNVLNGIDLKVYEGDFISILGESGSGKSTLLGLLGGMDTATYGKVLFDGTDLGMLKEKELAALRRTKLGFVFQFFNLAPYLTVKENILLPLFLDGKSIKKYEDSLNDLMDYLKISQNANKMPAQLSGGEQQRVAIARGLIYNPKVIFLDEPTGNLDSKNSEEIMLLLKQINNERGTTIIQVTHSESNALYGNRIVRIKDGKIIEENNIHYTRNMFSDEDKNLIEKTNAGFCDSNPESIVEIKENKEDN